MVKETEINNEEFVPQEKMLLVGIVPMSFATKNEDGVEEKIEGCMLNWLFYPPKDGTVIGREVGREFRRNTSPIDWQINADYEPDIKIKVVKGKPVAKIDGYKLVK